MDAHYPKRHLMCQSSGVLSTKQERSVLPLPSDETFKGNVNLKLISLKILCTQKIFKQKMTINSSLSVGTILYSRCELEMIPLILLIIKITEVNLQDGSQKFVESVQDI